MVETTHDFLEPIADGITLVRGANKGRFPFSHSILFSHGDGDYTLIDTGCGIEILKKRDNLLLKLKAKDLRSLSPLQELPHISLVYWQAGLLSL